ncbi:MAG: hypothetical protein ACRDRB_10825 [Pseudonocardiaceae bacterium]
MKILASKSAVGRSAAVVGPAMALLSTAVLLSGCLGSTQTSNIGTNWPCTSSGCHTVTGGDGGQGSKCSGNDGQGGNGTDGGGAGGQGSNGGGNGGQGSNGGNGTDARGGDGAPGGC